MHNEITQTDFSQEFSQDYTESGTGIMVSPSPQVLNLFLLQKVSLKPRKPKETKDSVIPVTHINAKEGGTCLLQAYLGLDGVRSQEHRSLRRTVDLFI